MQPYPHTYTVTAEGAAAGNIRLSAHGLPELASTAPREFDGPGDQWSPEALLIAAVASCFILTFRAVARASKLDWSSLDCSVQGTLERSEGAVRFTHMVTHAKLAVPAAVAEESCRKVLEKAEAGCLVANSLRCDRALQTEISRS